MMCSGPGWIPLRHCVRYVIFIASMGERSLTLKEYIMRGVERKGGRVWVSREGFLAHARVICEFPIVNKGI